MNTPDKSGVKQPILIQPSWALRSGFVMVGVDDVEAWVFVQAYRSLDDPDNLDAVEKCFRTPGTQALLVRLAATFQEFIPMTAAQWEADLRQAANPVTLLSLWRTAVDVFDYFTSGKKLPRGARLDYFYLILAFFNYGPQGCLRERWFWSLTPARAQRVVAEMERYYRR